MKRSYLVFILLFGLLHGCGPGKIVSNVTPGVNFSKFNSFWVLNAKGQKQDYSDKGSQIKDEVESEIERIFEDRGYTLSREPDILVTYDVLISPKIRRNANTNPYRSYTYRYNYYDYQTYRYNEGMFMVEIRDYKKKKIVWQGSIDLRSGRKPKNSSEFFRNAVNDVLTAYPYLAGSNKPIVPEDK